MPKGPKTISAAEYRRLVGGPIPPAAPSAGVSQSFSGSQSAPGVPAAAGRPSRKVPPERRKMNEGQVIAEIIAALRDRGYRTPEEAVASLVGVRGIYLRVQQHDARRSGSDKGVPDLMVWPFATVKLKDQRWRMFEAKRPVGGKIYPGQAFLASIGSSVIVYSAAEVLEVLGESLTPPQARVIW